MTSSGKSRRVARLAGGGAAALFTIAIATAGAVLASRAARADAILNPGVIHGVVGLQGFTVDAGRVDLYQGGAYAADSAFTGDRFDLTVESGRTYDRAAITLHVATPTFDGDLYLDQATSIAVPLGGAVNADLTRPGGTIAVHLDVTGGTFVGAHLLTYATDPSTGDGSRTDGWASSTASDLAVPVVASPGVQLTGTVQVEIHDADDNPVCVVTRTLTGRALDVAPGATVPFTESVSLTPDDCLLQITGAFVLRGLPPDLGYTAAIYADRQSRKSYPFDYAASADPSTPSYALGPVEPAAYLLSAWVDFRTPEGPACQMWLPDESAAADTTAGSATYDFVFDAQTVSGQVVVTGAPEGSLTGGWSQFVGQCDGPSGDPSCGGYSSGALSPTSRAYRAVVTPGGWAPTYHYLVFRPSPTQTSAFTVSDWGRPSFTVVAGQDVALPATELQVSRGQVIFDVVEASGPQVFITNPEIRAWSTDGGTRSVSLSGWASATAATPAVELIGPPGVYTFDAYATVNGTYARFVSSTVELGAPVNTPAGRNVTVVPTDSAGNPLPATLTFEEVTEPGVTTAALTDVGPSPPPGTIALAWAGNHTYGDISTTAHFRGKVELAYDYSNLEGARDNEGSLTMLHYVLTDDLGNGEWQEIKEVANPHSPPYTAADPLYFGRENQPANWNPDVVRDRLYGVTTSFSLFAITRSANKSCSDVCRFTFDCAATLGGPEIIQSRLPKGVWTLEGCVASCEAMTCDGKQVLLNCVGAAQCPAAPAGIAAGATYVEACLARSACRP
jgi:hypothetical protein